MVNYKNIKDLKNIHKGHDIWILMAGSSMNYIDTPLDFEFAKFVYKKGKE